MNKKIYTLEEAVTEDIKVIGGKGYHIAQLQKLKDDLDMDIDVPPAYILPTTLWADYNKNQKKTIALIRDELIPKIILGLANDTDGDFPMVSVRSGAPVSMPGMMDTILNLGINSENFEEYENKYGFEWASDCYTRFLTMYGEIALDMPKAEIKALREKKYNNLEEIEKTYKAFYKKHNQDFPKNDIETQLLTSICAVFDSWNNERAKTYREINNISETLGTAVIVQKMVFGNLNENSATAVIFSRNTNNGDDIVNGEFLVKAQGEDVVSGSETPEDFAEMRSWNSDLYESIKTNVKKLEEYFKDVQDVELTIEDGKLYFLQTRTAKRTPNASLKIAMNMSQDGMISKQDIFKRLSLKEYLNLNTKKIDSSYGVPSDASGLSASSGVIVGRVVFDKRGQEILSDKYSEPLILVAKETTPDDMPVLKEVDGVITCIGGVTSHAAVVARSLNKAAIVGCSNVKVSLGDEETKREDYVATFSGKEVREGDLITMDGETGRVWIGNDVPIDDASKNKNLLMLEDMIFDLYPFTRAVSNPADIFCDKPILFATYRYDNVPDNELELALKEAIEIVNDSIPPADEAYIIIDLQSKLDFIKSKYNENVPFTENMSKELMITKAEVLVNMYIPNKDRIKIYLGDHIDPGLADSGFTIVDKDYLKINHTNVNNNFLNIVTSLKPEHLENPSKNIAISGKNAVLSLLRR